MSANWFKDMQAMHKKYGVDEWMNKEKNSEWCKLRTFMDFRINIAGFSFNAAGLGTGLALKLAFAGLHVLVCLLFA